MQDIHSRFSMENFIYKKFDLIFQKRVVLDEMAAAIKERLR